MEANFDESKLWARVGEIVTGLGFSLFDLDEPRVNQKGQMLRVYIALADGTPKVTLDDCAEVSRAIWEADEVDRLLPEDCLIEVSSPGIERRLRRFEHFRGAVGETIKLKVERVDGKREVVKGKLVACDDSTLTMMAAKGEEKIALAEVADARTEFSFGERNR